MIRPLQRYVRCSFQDCWWKCVHWCSCWISLSVSSSWNYSGYDCPSTDDHAWLVRSTQGFRLVASLSYLARHQLCIFSHLSFLPFDAVWDGTMAFGILDAFGLTDMTLTIKYLGQHVTLQDLICFWGIYLTKRISGAMKMVCVLSIGVLELPTVSVHVGSAMYRDAHYPPGQ